MSNKKTNLFTDRFIKSLKPTQNQNKPIDMREGSGDGFAIKGFRPSTREKKGKR
jgi:hypothetical protein